MNQLRRLGQEMLLDLPKRIRKHEIQKLIISELKLRSRKVIRPLESHNRLQTKPLQAKSAARRRVVRQKITTRAICFWWRKGRCQRGTRCRFRHPSSVVRKIDVHNHRVKGSGDRRGQTDFGCGISNNQSLGERLRSSKKEYRPADALIKRGVSSVLGTNFDKKNCKCPNLSPKVSTKLQKEADRLWDWCKSQLQEFKEMPEAAKFLEPVAWRKLKLPLYPNIVKSPMDLGTISTKLDKHVYSDIFEFNKDMRLIWANAKKFNQPGSNIFMIAGFLARTWTEGLPALELTQQ